MAIEVVVERGAAVARLAAAVEDAAEQGVRERRPASAGPRNRTSVAGRHARVPAKTCRLTCVALQADDLRQRRCPGARRPRQFLVADAGRLHGDDVAGDLVRSRGSTFSCAVTSSSSAETRSTRRPAKASSPISGPVPVPGGLRERLEERRGPRPCPANSSVGLEDAADHGEHEPLAVGGRGGVHASKAFCCR